ncbi:hypothetical protein [Vibrio paucivorans]|uniref:Uncharacterized protein n=1 Tax=Vibrio paucivorans TaxID=2829489 RepID=A0A9X3CFQ3_9VIBR|nr:hypothetical protein [Vibrio paucivorans]MCW8334860.1 hypothetical protein [Vibrio paucivorans]
MEPLDKNYFVVPSHCPQQEIRSLFSDLTNKVLHHIDYGSDLTGARKLVEQILQYERYQNLDEPIQQRLENDLLSTCHYWEELYRYDLCWPIIRTL